MRRFGLVGEWIRSLLIGPAGFVLLLVAVYFLVMLLPKKRRERGLQLENAYWMLGFAGAFLLLCFPYPGVLLEMPLLAWSRSLQSRRPIAELTARREEPEAPLAVLVLGAGVQASGCLTSSSLQRIHFGHRIWQRLPNALFLFAEGGMGQYQVSQAVHEHLVRLGIPQERVVLEAESRNTQQNLKLCVPLLRSRGVSEVVLVTTERHVPRAYLVARRYGLAPHVAAPRAVIRWTPCPTWQHLHQLSAVLNEYAGIAGYFVVGWL